MVLVMLLLVPLGLTGEPADWPVCGLCHFAADKPARISGGQVLTLFFSVVGHTLAR